MKQILWWLREYRVCLHVGDLGLEGPLEKKMATLSSILAWKIPWTEEPGGLQSMESQGIRHELSDFKFTFNTENCCFSTSCLYF